MSEPSVFQKLMAKKRLLEGVLSGKKPIEPGKVEERRPPGHAPRLVDPKDPGLFKW